MPAPLGIVLAIVTTGLASAQTCGRESCPVTIRVPSPSHPTIQSGIDDLPNGGRLLLSPGRYVENLRIEGKTLTLLGPERDEGIAEIVGATQEEAVVAFARGGGGTLKNLDIQGGRYGVSGVAEDGTLPSAVELKDSRMTDSTRGVFGTFSELILKEVEIANTSWNGISLLGAEQVTSLGLVIHDVGGVGILIINHQPGAEFLIKDAIVSGNGAGGIEVQGGAGCVYISESKALFNFVSGLKLVNADCVLASQNHFSFSVAKRGFLGDGVAAFGSGDTIFSIQNTISVNERAAVSNYGSHVTIGENEMNVNSLDLVAGPWDGVSPTWSDLGGNVCDGEVCEASAADVVPPGPVGELA